MAYMLDGWDLWESDKNLQHLLDTCDTQELDVGNIVGLTHNDVIQTNTINFTNQNFIQSQIDRHGNGNDHVNVSSFVHSNVVDNNNNNNHNSKLLLDESMNPSTAKESEKPLLQGCVNNQCHFYGHVMFNIEQGEALKSNSCEGTPKLVLPVASGFRKREERYGKCFPCDICGGVLASKYNLKKHISVTHNVEKPYPCEVCGRTFKRKGDLKTHKLIHSDEKPFACHMCDRNFRRNGDLKEHILTHSDSKPYHCHICGNRFTQHSTLKTHILTHSGEHRYSCDICGKLFSVKTNLTAHSLTHSKEQPFHCEICGKKFSLKGNLKRHKSIHDEDT